MLGMMLVHLLWWCESGGDQRKKKKRGGGLLTSSMYLPISLSWSVEVLGVLRWWWYCPCCYC